MRLSEILTYNKHELLILSPRDCQHSEIVIKIDEGFTSNHRKWEQNNNNRRCWLEVILHSWQPKSRYSGLNETVLGNLGQSKLK